MKTHVNEKPVTINTNGKFSCPVCGSEIEPMMGSSSGVYSAICSYNHLFLYKIEESKEG